MKLVDFVLIKKIFVISCSLIIFSCSSLKHINNNYDQNMDFSYFTNKHSKNINQKPNYKTQLDIQNLQTINIIYFPLNKYYISSEFFYMLDMHADFLRNNPLYQIRIEGHADERGTPEYNIALGERRAYSVKTYLQSKGVLSEQIQTISYGKEKPIALGHNEEAYSKNRRAVLLY